MLKYKLVIIIGTKNLTKSSNILISQHNQVLYNECLLPNKAIEAVISITLLDSDLELTFLNKSIRISVLGLLSTHTFKETINGCEITLNCRPFSQGIIEFSIRGVNLDDLDTFDLSDPYFILYSDNQVLHKSEVIADNLNPTWKSFRIREHDIKHSIQLLVWDKDVNKDEFIGSCETELENLESGQTRKMLTNNGKKGDTMSGEIIINIKMLPDLLYKIYACRGINLAYLIAAGFDSRSPFKALDNIKRILDPFLKLSIGFASAEMDEWVIEPQQEDVFKNVILNNRVAGPCKIAPAIIRFYQTISHDLLWVVCVYLRSDIQDPITFQQLLNELKSTCVLFIFFVPASSTCPNLTSCKVLIFLLGFDFEAELDQLFPKIAIKLEEIINS